MDTLTKGFGYLIAYALPGFVALAGVAFVLPDAGTLLRVARDGNTSVGAFLFVVCIGIGAGVFLNGVRALTIDRFLPKPPAGQRTPETEGVYQNLLAQHYNYFQFYGNLIPAVLVFVVGWAVSARTPVWTWSTAGRASGTVVVEVILFLAARHALNRLHQKIGDLLSQPAGHRQEERV